MLRRAKGQRGVALLLFDGSSEAKQGYVPFASFEAAHAACCPAPLLHVRVSCVMCPIHHLCRSCPMYRFARGSARKWGGGVGGWVGGGREPCRNGSRCQAVSGRGLCRPPASMRRSAERAARSTSRGRETKYSIRVPGYIEGVHTHSPFMVATRTVCAPAMYVLAAAAAACACMRRRRHPSQHARHGGLPACLLRDNWLRLRARRLVHMRTDERR